MHQVVLDTETTGLSVKEGHRIIEIGCVELVDRCRTGRRFHHYLNPEREIEDGAFNVHGISEEQLRDMPLFAHIYGDLKNFISNAELIIHNAPFDIEFLDYEISSLSEPKSLDRIGNVCKVLDSLELARQLHPGQPCNLGALCKRYSIDIRQRLYHGALSDAELLTSVYLAMTNGGQVAMQLNNRLPTVAKLHKRTAGYQQPLIPTANAAERKEHEALLDTIKEQIGRPSLWHDLGY